MVVYTRAGCYNRSSTDSGGVGVWRGVGWVYGDDISLVKLEEGSQTVRI